MRIFIGTNVEVFNLRQKKRRRVAKDCVIHAIEHDKQNYRFTFKGSPHIVSKEWATIVTNCEDCVYCNRVLELDTEDAEELQSLPCSCYKDCVVVEERRDNPKNVFS